MAPNHTFMVRCEWDEEARVWYVADSEVPGLVAEADTVDELVAKLKDLVPEMLVENGIIGRNDGLPEVPFQMLLDHLKSQRAAC